MAVVLQPSWFSVEGEQAKPQWGIAGQRVS